MSVGCGVVLFLGLYLTWWWVKPVHWLDGEGPIRREGDHLDTDLGSARWHLLRLSGFRELGLLLDLRDWWENNIVRRRGRRRRYNRR